jgi:hypothetical protein
MFGSEREEETACPRNLYSTCILLQAGDEIEKREMRGACIIYKSYEKCIQKFGLESLR